MPTIRRSRDGSGFAGSDLTATDGSGEKLQAQVCSNQLENGEVPAGTWFYAAAAGGIVNSTSGVTVTAAAGAGIRNYVKSLQIACDTLGGATEFVIRDGASGTVIWRGKLQTTALQADTINFDPPIKGTANTLVEVATLTAVTGGVYVNLQGYTA
jgi:hypothetical protein